MSKVLFSWWRGQIHTELKSGFFKNTFHEFYLYPSIIFHKLVIPPLEEPRDYEMIIRGMRIFLIGKYYLDFEIVTRNYATKQSEEDN